METTSEHYLLWPSYWHNCNAGTTTAKPSSAVDASLKTDFLAYKQQYHNPFYVLLGNFFLSISFLATLISAVYYTNLQDEEGFKTSVVVLMHIAWVCLFVASCCSWTTFLHPQHTANTETTRFIVIITTSLGFAARLFARINVGMCKAQSIAFVQGWNCNPCFLDKGFPADTTLCLLALPFIFTTLYKETRLDFLLSSWLIVLSAFIISSVCIGSQSHTLELLPFLLLALFVILDFSKAHVRGFLSNRNYEEQLRLKDCPHNEMKSMIANVAHDLKTPLSSFMTGVDALGQIVRDCRHNMQDGEIDAKQLISCVDSMQLCLHNIRDTNSFMLMTINRCIDYTKASKGIKLVPKPETIHLLDSLRLPLNCMKNIQEKVSIVLNPIPAEVCSHIITDKQWLQENVLCLLSNAVKYSSGGEVTITLSVADSFSPHSSGKHDELISASPVQSSRNSFSSTFQSRVQPDCTSTIRNDDISIHSAVDKFILVEIEDEGIGVPDTSKDTLFNPFKQTQKLAGGTGLGLFSLAKRMEAIHGHYGVKKRLDGRQGSLFWFAIPYRPDVIIAQTSAIPNQDNTPELDESSRPSTPEVSQAWLGLSLNIPSEVERYIDSTTPKQPTTPSALSILIAEDSHTISRMTAMILSRHGHLVEVVENGAMAISAIEKRLAYTASKNKAAFDVVLMDLQMPVMDGLEATKRIRESEKSSTIKQLIFGLSADWDEEVSQAASTAGIDILLQKPFNVNEFYRIIKQYTNPTAI